MSAAKTFEVATTEYYVRGRGYIKSVEDIENIPLKVGNGTPVYVKNVGTVHLGRDIRRGVAELNGKGEIVGGIVVMRYGENALNVIDGIKKKIEEIKASLPAGREDRSDLRSQRAHQNAPSPRCAESSSRKASSSPWSAWFFFGTCAPPSSRSSPCRSPSFFLSSRCNDSA